MMPQKHVARMAAMATAAFLTVPAGAAAASPPSGAGPATAQPAPSVAECPANAADTAGAEHTDTFDMTLIDGASAERFAADVTALVDDGEVTVHAPVETLERDRVKVYQVDAGSEQQQFTSVSVPISGSYSEPLSHLTVLFDADGVVVQYAETLFSQGDSGTFHITSYVDGALTNNEDTGIPYMGDEELRSEVAAATETVAANTAACLAAVLGVSAAVAAAIAYACVGACSVPITPVTAPVCAACVGGFAVVGGASITAIASCF